MASVSCLDFVYYICCIFDIQAMKPSEVTQGHWQGHSSAGHLLLSVITCHPVLFLRYWRWWRAVEIWVRIIQGTTL